MINELGGWLYGAMKTTVKGQVFQEVGSKRRAFM
jgi:hypothetical protein